MTLTHVLSSAELTDVGARMAQAGVRPAGPLTAVPISGGRSNLTFCLSDGQQKWVLRMPPRSGRTPSAHDVTREYRVTRALAGSAFPVSRPLLLCEDESVVGAPFVVTQYIAGRSVQTRTELDELDDNTLDELMRLVVVTLVELHSVDHVAVGLERFGKPTGYAARQLATWSRQWESVGLPELAALEREVTTGIGAHVTEQMMRTSIVHGDYRLDNTLVITEDGVRLHAVVDWELSTVGDPAADVALMGAYRHPAFDLIVGETSAWTSSRLPSPDGLAELYVAAGGADLDDWRPHLALAHYKVGVIAAGIEHRLRAGSGDGPGFDTSARAVEPFLQTAHDLLRRDA